MKKYLVLYKMLLLCLPSFAQIKISGGANLVSNGNAIITIKDLNIVNDGNFIAGTGKVKFTGSTNNSIGGSSSTNFNELEIAKTGSSSLLLQSSISVNSKINFTSGLIDLNQKNISLAPNALLINESENSRITGTNGGEVMMTVNINKPNNLNPGNLGAIFNTNSNLGSVTIKRGHKAQAGSGLSSGINRYFNIQSSGNKKNSTTTLRLQYFDAELNGKNENSLVFFQSLDNGASWTNQSFRSRDVAANWVEKAMLKSLGLLTLSSDVQTLTARINTSTSQNEADLTLTKKLTVGPNPNNGNFWFFVTGIDKDASAALYTIDGKLLQQFKVVSLQQQRVNGLRSGTYILKVEGLPPFKVIVQADGNPIK